MIRIDGGSSNYLEYSNYRTSLRSCAIFISSRFTIKSKKSPTASVVSNTFAVLFSDNLQTFDESKEIDRVYYNQRRHSSVFGPTRAHHQLASRRYSLLVISDELPLRAVSEDSEESDDAIVQGVESGCLSEGERSFSDVSVHRSGNLIAFDEFDGEGRIVLRDFRH